MGEVGMDIAKSPRPGRSEPVHPWPHEDTKSFTITFPFPEALRNPSDYVVMIGGYQDSSRTPRIGSQADTLGYARIRVE